MTAQLARIQRLFWEAIRFPTGIEDYLKQSGSETRALFDATFAESPEFLRRERLEVYAQGYFFRLLDVLAEMFPLLKWRVGADNFHNLVTDYVLAHPSRSPSLRDLGEALPQFLHTHRLTLERPELPDLCRVELTISKLLDGPDSGLLSAARLFEIPPDAWPALRMRPVPNLVLLRSDWDYCAFSRAQFAEQRPRDPVRPARRAAAEVGLARLDQPSWILVWRKGFQVFTRNVESAEADMLLALGRGETFGDVSTRAERYGIGPERLVAFLGRWLRDELLAQVEQPGLGP